MLIFDKGLHIIFVDDNLERKAGVIKNIIPFEKGNRYVVDAYEQGTITECYSISENQILQVWIKDTDGFNVWVKVEALYSAYPNDYIIKPNTIYRLVIDGKRAGRLPLNACTHKTEEEDKSMIPNLIGERISFETPDDGSRHEGFVCEEIPANCTYRVLANGGIFFIDSTRIRAIYDKDTKRWMSITAWKIAHSLSKDENRYIISDEKAVRLVSRWCADPEKVIFNGPATVVLWKDGTKTIVKRREGEEDDREKAVMYAILKKLCGNKASMDRYLKQFFKDKEVESNQSSCNIITKQFENMYAILKKVCGNKASMDRYLKQFFKDKEVESNEEKAD